MTSTRSPQATPQASTSLPADADWLTDCPDIATPLRPLVAIEKQPPHAIGLYRVSEAMLANGDKKRALAIDRFCAAQASGAWPAYPAQIQTLQLPAWAQWNPQA